MVQCDVINNIIGEIPQKENTMKHIAIRILLITLALVLGLSGVACATQQTDEPEVF